MSTPSFLENPDNPKARRPRSLGERIFLVDDGRLRAYVRVLLFVFCVLAIQVVVAGLIGEYSRHLSILGGCSSGVPSFWLISFFSLSWIFVRFVDHRDFSTLGLTLQPEWGRELGVGLAFGITLQLIVLGNSRRHAFSPLFTRRRIQSAFLEAVARCRLYYLPCAATVEELSFRGYALKWLMWSVGAPAALYSAASYLALAT